MKYTILINQVGVVKAGLASKTDLVDWAIIDYLSQWYFAERKRTIFMQERGASYVWLNYRHLLEEMPLLGIKDKDALSNRIKKLKQLGLIDTFQAADRTLYFILTPKCIQVIGFTSNDKELPGGNGTGPSHDDGIGGLSHDDGIGLSHGDGTGLSYGNGTAQTYNQANMQPINRNALPCNNELVGDRDTLPCDNNNTLSRINFVDARESNAAHTFDAPSSNDVKARGGDVARASGPPGGRINGDVARTFDTASSNGVEVRGGDVARASDLRINAADAQGEDAAHTSDPPNRKQPRKPFRSKLQESLFDEFWAQYPRRRSKGQAERAWVKIAPDLELFAKIMEGLQRAKASFDWQKDGGRWIPYPATWLNAKGWEDEFESATGTLRGHPQQTQPPKSSKYANIYLTCASNGSRPDGARNPPA